MRTKFGVLLLLALLAIQVFPARAAGPAAFLFPQWVDFSAFPEVTVHLSAWDAAGLPLANLIPEHFTISEDGGPPFHPDQALSDRNAPLWVALVIDVSGSMSGRPLEDAKQAAARFLDRLGPEDHVALIAFSDAVNPDPAVLAPQREIAFTSDKTAVYDAVEVLGASGETQLYNAAAKAVNLFAEAPPGHRAVLLLSDGRNEPAEVGEPTLATKLATEARVPFFIVGLGSQIDLPYLQRLTGDTGGLFRPAPRSSELAALFEEMATLLKTQYRLTYTSSLPEDGKLHTLALGLRTAEVEVQAQTQFGPLPLQPPTATAPLPSSTPLASTTPQPSATPPPTATMPPPTTTPLPPPAPTPLPPPPESGGIQAMLRNPLAWLVAALIVLIPAALLLLRRPGTRRERCAKCGFDLTGHSGACPQCGGTKRIAEADIRTRP